VKFPSLLTAISTNTIARTMSEITTVYRVPFIILFRYNDHVLRGKVQVIGTGVAH
jgi:hypothetical protein